jgi:hypothetical protein
MSDHARSLQSVKVHYPFAQWAVSGLEDLNTAETCAAFARIFDNLIAKLIALGELAPEKAKLEAFREAVEALNELSEKDRSLIETGEREGLCALCNMVARAAGLDPSKYGQGEGPASEWREW